MWDVRADSASCTWYGVCGFCCIGIGRRRGTTARLGQWASDNNGAVRVQQSSFQRTDVVKVNSWQTACEPKRGQLGQLCIHLIRLWTRREKHKDAEDRFVISEIQLHIQRFTGNECYIYLDETMVVISSIKPSCFLFIEEIIFHCQLSKQNTDMRYGTILI